MGEIDELETDITKDMGEGIMVSANALPPATHIPLNNFILDLATLGGFAEGCGHMVYGNEGCGKTTLWIQVVASLLRKYPKGYVVWVDVEKKFDTLWAEKHGVYISRVKLVRPSTGE